MDALEQNDGSGVDGDTLMTLSGKPEGIGGKPDTSASTPKDQRREGWPASESDDRDGSRTSGFDSHLPSTKPAEPPSPTAQADPTREEVERWIPEHSDDSYGGCTGCTRWDAASEELTTVASPCPTYRLARALLAAWDEIGEYRTQSWAYQETATLQRERAEKAEQGNVDLCRHRDHWRGFAYGRRDRPTDFLGGNMCDEDRGPTLLDRAEKAEAERDAAREKIRRMVGIVRQERGEGGVNVSEREVGGFAACIRILKAFRKLDE